MTVAETPSLWRFFFPSISRFYYSYSREARSLEKLNGLPKATQRQVSSSGQTLLFSNSQGYDCEKAKLNPIGCSVPEQTQIKYKIQVN